MLDKMRLYATLIVWLAFTFIVTLLSWYVFTFDDIAGPSAVFAAALLISITLAATLSTRAIWHHAPPVHSDQRRDETAGRAANHKTKRAGQDRVARLIEDLDDDEIYDLEALLLAREGDGDGHAELTAHPYR